MDNLAEIRKKKLDIRNSLKCSLIKSGKISNINGHVNANLNVNV